MKKLNSTFLILLVFAINNFIYAQIEDSAEKTNITNAKEVGDNGTLNKKNSRVSDLKRGGFAEAQFEVQNDSMVYSSLLSNNAEGFGVSYTNYNTNLRNEDDATSYGLYSRTYNDADSTTSYAGYFSEDSFGSTSTSYGIYSQVNGSGRNYGVYGSTNKTGVDDFAGYFQGKVGLDYFLTDDHGAVLLSNFNYEHSTGIQTFGNDFTGDPFMLASEEEGSETGGIYGDGNHVTIWSPGDGYSDAGLPFPALLSVIDEDDMDSADVSPWNNTGLKWYLTESGGWVASDINRKENINQYTNSLEKISLLDVFTYNYKLAPQEVEKGDQPIEVIGVMAQSVNEVIPHAINTNAFGEMFINYNQITAVLIGAIKELEAKVAQLETELKK